MRGQQLGGAGVIRRGVVGQVADIDAEPDLGGEMEHRVDAGQSAVDGGRITHVGNHQLDAGRRAPAVMSAMHVRPQRIQHADLVAAR